MSASRNALVRIDGSERIGQGSYRKGGEPIYDTKTNSKDGVCDMRVSLGCLQLKEPGMEDFSGPRCPDNLWL